MTFLEIALNCIARGWHVFPCWPGDKRPLVKGGFLSATNLENSPRVVDKVAGRQRWDCNRRERVDRPRL